MRVSNILTYCAFVANTAFSMPVLNLGTASEDVSEHDKRQLESLLGTLKGLLGGVMGDEKAEDESATPTPTPASTPTSTPSSMAVRTFEVTVTQDAGA